VVQL